MLDQDIRRIRWQARNQPAKQERRRPCARKLSDEQEWSIRGPDACERLCYSDGKERVNRSMGTRALFGGACKNHCETI